MKKKHMQLQRYSQAKLMHDLKRTIMLLSIPVSIALLGLQVSTANTAASDRSPQSRDNNCELIKKVYAQTHYDGAPCRWSSKPQVACVINDGSRRADYMIPRGLYKNIQNIYTNKRLMHKMCRLARLPISTCKDNPLGPYAEFGSKANGVVLSHDVKSKSKNMFEETRGQINYLSKLYKITHCLK